MTAPKKKPRDDTSVWVNPKEGANITGLNVQTIRRLVVKKNSPTFALAAAF